MKCFENRKKIWISCCMCLILLALFIGLTLSRYGTSMNGYASIIPARFYAKIIGDNVSEELKGVGSTPIEFGSDRVGAEKSLKFNLKPGMDIAKGTNATVYFAISNGTTISNYAEIPIEYTLQIITTKNLPLKLTLVQLQDDSQNRYVELPDSTLYPLQSSATLDETIGECYIYNFYTDSAYTTEKVFEIEGDGLNLNRYGLKIEWPPEVDKSGVEYCKEIELLEVRALVKSEVDGETKEIELAEIYEDGYIELNLPRSEGDPMNESVAYETRFANMEVVTSEENGKTAEYGFQIFNGNQAESTLPRNIVSAYHIRIPLPEFAAGYRYTLKNGGKIYEGQVENGVLKFYSEENTEAEFILHKWEYMNDTTDIVTGIVTGETYTLCVQDPSPGQPLIEILEKNHEGMIEGLSKEDMAKLLEVFEIKLDVTYSDYNR